MMKNILENIKFDLYLVLLAGLAFLSYIGYFTDYIMPLFIILALVAVFTKQKIIYIIPIVFFIEMVFRDLNDTSSLVSVYTFAVGALLVLDFVWNRRLVRLGVLTIPLLIFSILGLFTFINSPDYYISFEGWIQTSVLIFIYMFFVNAFDDDETNFSHIAKLFMYLAILITFEMLHFVGTHDLEPIEVIRRRLIDLGGKNLNLVIYANIVAIPLIGYLVLKSKFKVIYMFFGILTALGIFLTLSRSSILTLAVYAALLAPTIMYLEKKKINFIIQGLVFVVLLGIGLLILEQYDLVSDYFATLFARDITYFDDRKELLEVAWEQFKEHPLLGNGGVYISRYYLAELGPISYHNVFAQASTLGILGLGALGYMFYIKTKLVLSKKHDFVWFALILIFVTAFVNGLLQPMYFNSSYMNFIFIIIASIEVYKSSDKDNNKAIKEDN